MGVRNIAVWLSFFLSFFSFFFFFSYMMRISRGERGPTARVKETTSIIAHYHILQSDLRRRVLV